MASAEVRGPDALPKVQLGRTGMNITRIGFGDWATGGPDWAVGCGLQSDEQSVRAIQHAIQRGINWIDTPAPAARPRRLTGWMQGAWR